MKLFLIALAALWAVVSLGPAPQLIRKRIPGTLVIVLSGLILISQFLFRLLRGANPSPQQLSLPVCALLLAWLLIPVPFEKSSGLKYLQPAVLSAGFLPFFGVPPEGTALVLLFLFLAGRFLRERDRRRSVRSRMISFRYRDAVCEGVACGLEEVWTALLVLSLCGPVSALSAALGGLFLAGVLLARLLSGNPLAVLPRYENQIRDTAARLEEESLPPEGLESERVLYERCCRYMAEKKPFLVESFSISDLANAVYTNKTYLSKTINRQSGKNFRQFLNAYRIAYSKELFMRNMSLKVNDLAELSGFHTITTYTMAFKVVMDESPSSWCRRMRIQSLQ